MEEEEGKFGNFSANVAKLYVLLFIQFAGDKSGRKPCYIYCTLEKNSEKAEAHGTVCTNILQKYIYSTYSISLHSFRYELM